MPTSRQDNSFTNGLGAGFNSKEKTPRAELTGPCAEWLRRDSLRPEKVPVDHWRLEGAGVDQWIHIWTLWFIAGFPGQLLSISSVISIVRTRMATTESCNAMTAGPLPSEGQWAQTFIKDLLEIAETSRQDPAAFSIQLDQLDRTRIERGKSSGTRAAAGAAALIPLLTSIKNYGHLEFWGSKTNFLIWRHNSHSDYLVWI